MSELIWHNCPQCPEFYLTPQPLTVHLKRKHGNQGKVKA